MLINGGEISGTEINGLFDDSVFPAIFVSKPVISSLFFKCIVTGLVDSLSNVVVPISSITGSLNSLGLKSLLVVCPDGLTYGPDIVARSNGGFIVQTIEEYSDGSRSIIDSYEYAFSSIGSDRGAKSWSISMRGKTSIVELLPKKYDAIGLSILSTSAIGKRRLRIDYNSNLRPLDTLVLFDGSEVVAGVITYNISSINMYMTVTEI